MSETVLIRQNSQFETQFFAADPRLPDSDKLVAVGQMHELTPYGMMLASLGSCTAIVVNSYANNHGLSLDEVELRLTYERIFQEDCDNCEHIDRYEEQIVEAITFRGDLDGREREKLLRIAHQCPIYKMFKAGVAIESGLSE